MGQQPGIKEVLFSTHEAVFSLAGALIGEELSVGMVETTTTTSIGTTVWLAALTLVMFVLMTVTLNRWRKRRRQRRLEQEDDVTSCDDVSMSDVTSVTVPTPETPTPCHTNSAFPAEELRTHVDPSITKC